MLHFCPLWLCPSTGIGERSFKEVSISWPQEQTWLATHHWLLSSQLCSRELRLDMRNHEEHPRTNPGLFRNWSFQESNRWPPTSQVGGSQRTYCKLWVYFWLGAGKHWCRHRKYYICPAPLHQPLNYPPKLGCHTLVLQGTLKPVKNGVSYPNQYRNGGASTGVFDYERDSKSRFLFLVNIDFIAFME